MTAIESALRGLVRLVFIAIAIPLGAWAADGTDSEWPTYGNDPGGTRYAPLTQVTRANVAQLTQVWSYRTGDLGEGFPSSERMAFEATPILVDGVLYVSTPYGQVHAINPSSGERLWQFDAHLSKDRHYDENTSRGVSAWRDADAAVGTPCALRILFGTLDARLIALDAKTGLACADFGKQGTVDLNEGSRPRDRGSYLVTSPPALWHNLVVTGSAVGDNRAVDNELGIVRAFDARTGALVWTWDPIPRSAGQPGVLANGPPKRRRSPAPRTRGRCCRSTPNAVCCSCRSARRVPTSSAANAPATTATRTRSSRLNAATGAVVWARQLVHHDVWDYDMPAQPVLIDLQRNGQTIPAVVQATKMGMLFVLDRRTGEPLFDIEERAVPQNGVDGEVLSPTQPFSALPSLVPNGPLTEADAWGFTPWDRGKCADQIRQAALRRHLHAAEPARHDRVARLRGRFELGQRVVRSDAPVRHREHQSVAVRRAVDQARRVEGHVRVEGVSRFRVRAPDRYAVRHAPPADRVAHRRAVHGAAVGNADGDEPADRIDRVAGAARHVARSCAMAGVVHRRRAEHGWLDRDRRRR